MAIATTTILAAAAVTTAAATVYGTVQQKKAASAQQRQQKMEAERTQRAALRETQIRRAQAMAQAQAMGAVGGSGVSGGIGSLSSQYGSALGYSGQMSGLSQQITMANYRANLYGGIADIAGSGFSQMGGLPTLLEKFK